MGKGVTESSAWIGAGLAALGLWAVACLWFPLTDTDIWWHLAAARWMLEHGAVPRADPFALSSLNKPWIDLHWGFQLLSHALWSLAGAAGLVAGKVAALLGALYLALRPHLRPANGAALLVLAAFGIFHSRFFLDMRPLAVTMLGLSLLHLATMSHLEGRLRRPYLILVPVQVVLANMQGLYPLGAFLVTCLLAGAWWERRRGRAAEKTASLKTLGFTTAALWLAGFATPYGWPGFLLPLTLLARITPLPGNVFSAEIAENQPLYALASQDPRALVPWLLILFAALWTFGRARSRFSLGHALVLGGFGLLGIMAQRNLPLFFLAALLAAGRNLKVSPSADVQPAAGMGPWPAKPWMPLAAIALLALLYAPRIRQAWAYELPGSLETPFRFPSQAADYLEAHPLPGRLFNELRFGGYLAFRLHPRLVYVDGRMILRDAAFYEEFLAVVDGPSGFPAYAARKGLTHALLPIGEDGRFLPLAAYLMGHEKWSLLYCDGAAVLLAQSSIAGELALPVDAFPEDHAVLQALRKRFAANPRLETIARRNLHHLVQEAQASGTP